jgi:mannose-6-phosphate isomerase
MSASPAIAPFRTEPAYHLRPWGGRAMQTSLGKKIPEGTVAEAWEVSAHPNGICRIASGPRAGMGLDQLVREAGPALLGARVHERHAGQFPVLIKLIDVNALASVQVHPDDAGAMRLEGWPRGKTEAWYIISRTPQARFSLGLVPGVTPDRFREALQDGRAQDMLQSPEVHPGDCLFVPPGTVHAAGNGVLLLEVQQSSDITYRVYDWDRVDQKGDRRELHVEKAMQVIDFSARPRIHRAASREDSLNPILSCAHFEMAEARVASTVRLPSAAACAAGTVVSGAAALEGGSETLPLRAGDSFVVPPGQETRLVRSGDHPAVIVMTWLA